MPGLDNKISNIIGTAIPTWLLKQLEARSNKNTLNTRDTQNILYLANKSAWVRLVSSINISKNDIPYFQKLGATISNEEDLAKNYVLFGGTSKYKANNNRNFPSYDIRSGIQNDGAYNLLKDGEINKYGYRPMPGITGVNIETKGTLGSIREATINFKVWDKDQLDIMDALYFKLGFSMFLEWGHTYFYHSPRESANINPDTIYSTEDFSIDPFKENLKKEEIYYQISKNVRDSEGNYDAMLGIITNFNFNYNEAGGFDCSLKLTSLGYLGDRIKINHPKTLPDILQEEIKQLNNVYKKIKSLQEIEQQKIQTDDAEKQRLEELAKKEALKDSKDSIWKTLQKKEQREKGIPKGDGSYGLVGDSFTANDLGLDFFKKYAIAKSTLLTNTSDLDYQKRGEYDYIYENNLFLTQPGIVLNGSIGQPNDITNLIQKIELDNLYIQSTVFAGQAFNNIVSKERIISNFKRDFIYKSSFNKLNGEFKSYSFSFELQYPYTDVKGNKLDGTGTIPDSIKTKMASTFLTEYFNKNSSDLVSVQSYKLRISSSSSKYYTLIIQGNLKWGATTNTKTNVTSTVTGEEEVKNTPGKSYINVPFTIMFEDSSLIKTILLKSNQDQSKEYVDYSFQIKKLEDQNKQQTSQTTEDTSSNVDASSIQVDSADNHMSSLELMLRTIQIHSLGKAINSTNDANIKKEVYKVDLTKEKTQGKSLTDQLFSQGVFSPFINNLISGNTSESGYPNENTLEVFAKYGFNTALLGNKAELSDLREKSVDYKALLTSYVIPYQINQSITEGTSVNHPVYIQLGTLLMILNHMCTIYDTPDAANDPKNQTPLVYIDFNPETNFCLSTNKHLSTNPFHFLIPFEGSFEDYKSLFDVNLLDKKNKDNIAPTSDSTQSTPLFNTQKDDRLSGQIPRFKYDEKSTSGAVAYKGKIMKVLVNIDYLLNMVKQYSQKNETNNVYLKPFLEQILSELNKSLGNFNLLRLVYNDSANTFQIVDDQLTPGDENENFISPDNQDEIPLYGLKSIGKNIQIKTDISTKLSNMIAISANSNPGDVSPKSTLSTNSTDFGFINTGYKDRYINNRTEPGSQNKADDRVNDALINAAIRFNQTISDFYSTINPSDSNVNQATNYYIEKMSRIKAENTATRASAMIPVSLNFNTDGIAGMNMGQGFTISDKFLPYTYNERNVVGSNIQKVGFVVFGLNHSIENNQWNTDVRANMIYLKKLSDFKGEILKNLGSTKEFNYNANNAADIRFTSYNALTNPVTNPQFIGVTSQRDATNGGALEQRIVNISNDIFKEIKLKDKNININITAGNDKWHQENVSYYSKHKIGRALDFTVEPATEQNKALVNNILSAFKSKESGFNFINEYSNPSFKSTGGHFHIQYT